MRSGGSIRVSAPATTFRAISYTTVRLFVDTNVLLYAMLPVGAAGDKRSVARAIVASPRIAVSVQVLQEFYTQATRSNRDDRITHAEATAVVEHLLSFPVQSLTAPLVMAAIATCERFQISYWDAAIIEAARALGCDMVLTEDLNDGQDYGGVRVENPFHDL